VVGYDEPLPLGKMQRQVVMRERALKLNLRWAPPPPDMHQVPLHNFKMLLFEVWRAPHHPHFSRCLSVSLPLSSNSLAR
jgi:hypothetical protein